MTGRMTRALLFSLCLPLACGTHADDEIPDELLDAIAAGSSKRADYPEGPYGGALGDVAPDVCVEGWLDPAAANFDGAAMQTLCFSDFWDPEAASHRLLLVNTAAIWCSACQVEYQGAGSRDSLSAEVASRRDRGLRILGTLFQDASRRPARPEDGVAWARAFEVDFAFGIDADFEMGAFADADVQPFNLVVDTRDMRVVHRVQGDNPDQLWPVVDERLEAE
jgi:hypothetical protein